MDDTILRVNTEQREMNYTDKKLFVCDKCGKVLSRRYLLAKHEKTRANDPSHKR